MTPVGGDDGYLDAARMTDTRLLRALHASPSVALSLPCLAPGLAPILALSPTSFPLRVLSVFLAGIVLLCRCCLPTYLTLVVRLWPISSRGEEGGVKTGR